MGAKPDGKTICTDLIQKAVDHCSASGGGKVTVPTGVFLTGTIYLRSNTTLHLENGAVLLGSTKIEDYRPRNVIRAFNAQNICITGNGTINGQGHVFWFRPTEEDLVLRREESDYSRSQYWYSKYLHNNPSAGNLIQLEACKNVIIENVTLTGSESWTLHLLGCDDVLVSGIKIRNPMHGPNTDGIDLQACSNIKISNCDIYTRDDAIVIKNRHPNYYGKVCENITVTGCVLITVCNGFKIGTESISDFRNIVFTNSVIQTPKPDDELAKTMLTIINPNSNRYELAPRSGIALETVDGSNIQGITITNIVMDGVRVPIFIRLANRGAGEQKAPVPVPGTLKDVNISNIVVNEAMMASSISAIPGYYVENVMLNNILIRTDGGGDKELAQKELDEKINLYPEGTMWGSMPVSGFFVRHVKGLQMNNIKIITKTDDMRPLAKFDDISDLFIDNLQTNDVYKGECVLDLNNVREARILNLDFPETVKIPWVLFKGALSENIIIQTIERSTGKNLMKVDKLVKADAIKVAN